MGCDGYRPSDSKTHMRSRSGDQRRIRSILATLSDLARVSDSLRAGLTADFIGRPDGLPGLTSAYGIHFHSVRALLPAIKYQAIASGAVDVIDGYSTDGLIARYDLVVLHDDRRFYPPYQAAAVISERLQRDDPGAALVLTELSGRIDDAFMRTLNERVEVAGIDAAAVAHDALVALGLIGSDHRGAAPPGVAPGRRPASPARVPARSAQRHHRRAPSDMSFSSPSHWLPHCSSRCHSAWRSRSSLAKRRA